MNADWTSVGLTELRKNLGDSVLRVASEPQKVVQVENRDQPIALVVSYERLAPLFSALASPDQFVDALRWLLLERWIGAASRNLRTPQLRDLGALGQKVVVDLLSVDPATASEDDLSNAGVPKDIASRLLKRRRIARAVADADADGLYDVSEHHSAESV